MWRRLSRIVLNAFAMVAAIFCFVVVLAWCVSFATAAFGQTVSPIIGEAGALHDIWDFAKTAGPFGTVLTFYVWQRADAERRKLQGERDALLERVLNGNSTHLAEIVAIRQLLQSIGRHGP